MSTDRGGTWKDCGPLQDGLDLTDHVKGHSQYLLKFHTCAKKLLNSGLTMTTVCQANSSVLPRLKDGDTTVRFQASGQAVVSAGPELPLAKSHLVAGKFGTPRVTLALATPRGAPVAAVYAAAHVNSSNPPRPDVKYQIEWSGDDGKTWQPVVADWNIPRMGDEPSDFWSQSMCWGSTAIKKQPASRVYVRFRNNGGKSYARAEMHLVYKTPGADETEVTFDWVDDAGPHQANHRVPAGAGDRGDSWTIATGQNVRMRWVEFEPMTKRPAGASPTPAP